MKNVFRKKIYSNNCVNRCDEGFNFKMKVAIILSSLFLLTDSKIAEIPLPSNIKECFEKSRTQQGSSPAIGEVVFARCVHRILWTPSEKSDIKTSLAEDAKTWITHLLEMNRMYDVYDVKDKTADSRQNDTVHMTTFESQRRKLSRPKRQGRQPRVRKEYRALTERERALFHRAVNMLKQDRSVAPNKFDALGRLHYLSVSRGHYGPNFFPWHRLFLVVFENALREKIPTVTIPYWDSTLDDNLLDPRSSILWTPEFMGTANGYVNDGPFANWITPVGPLIRYFGTAGTMLNWTYIKNSLRKNHLAEITAPYAKPDDNLEEHHNQVHLWVGGTMAPPPLAAFDPLFYLLHSFTDLIWEIFRGLQKRRGIDPTTDYPQNRTELPQGQAFSDPSGFGTLLNRHALSDVFIDNIYKYDRPPYCTRQIPSCRSDHIRCDTSGQEPKCVSASIFDIQRMFTTSGLPMDGSSGIREVRSTRHRKHTIEQVKNTVQSAAKLSCSSNNIDEHYVNNFIIDGTIRKEDWVYIPVNVIYSNKSRSLNETNDIYHQCKNVNMLNSPVRIFIESNGITYSGIYKEIVHFRKDLKVSKETAFAGIKKPNKAEHSDVLISAYDSCGRVCQPFCFDDVNKTYHRCTGALRVTDTKPLQFAKDVTSASYEMWQVDHKGFMTEKNGGVFLTLLCNAKESFWPW